MFTCTFLGYCDFLCTDGGAGKERTWGGVNVSPYRLIYKCVSNSGVNVKLCLYQCIKKPVIKKARLKHKYVLYTFLHALLAQMFVPLAVGKSLDCCLEDAKQKDKWK